jgi:cytochrome P450
MLSLDGPEHLRHRRPFGSAFRATQVDERFGPSTTGLAAQLVDAVRPAGQADLRAALAGPLSVGVVAAALGLRGVDAATVLRWYAAIGGAVTDITAGSAARPEAADALADLAAAVRSVLTPGDRSLLAAAAPALSPAEITSNAAVLMFGGIDTTDGMIANALLHVLGTPGLAEALRVDRALLGPVVEESLRLEPAASVVDRYATADVTLGGAAVRRGDLVRVSLTAANRDPAVFPDPDVFDLWRPNLDQHVAFARGPHSCLAMDLARLETRASLGAVLDRLPGVRLAGATAVTGLVFRKPTSLPVVWDVEA